MNQPPIVHYSLGVTNDVMFDLITARLSKESHVVDFGAGHGHMSQRIGGFFERQGCDPAGRLTPCDITPEIFQYQAVSCRKIGTNSGIPVEDGSQDLIYAIEVIEHLARPYDFFLEASAKLKPGGNLIFSTPNLLNMKSRFQYFFTGYQEMFGPPSVEDRNAGRLCGHIMPLSYPYFVYGLRRAGFDGMEFHSDRLKRSAMFMALLLYPLLLLGSWVISRRLKKADEEVWHEIKSLIWRVNRLDVLASRSCIVVARKLA